MRILNLGVERELTIAEDFSCENEPGCVVWDAALTLAFYLQLHQELVAGKRVLELICGRGAVGGAAAALGAAAVTATDLPHIVPPVRANIEVNGLAAAATGAALVWGDSVEPLRPSFDVILASDVVYQAEPLPLFVQSLKALSSPTTLTILCNEHRPCPSPGSSFVVPGLRRSRCR